MTDPAPLSGLSDDQLLDVARQRGIDAHPVTQLTDEQLLGEALKRGMQTSARTAAGQGNGVPLRGMGVMDDPQYAASNLLNARASLAPDVKDQIKRYSTGMGIPEERFGVVNGDIVYYVPERNAYAKVTPSIGAGSGVTDTASRVLSQTAAGLGPMLPAAAATATGAAMGPTGLSIPATGVAAGATDLLRQGLDKTLAGENPLNLGSYDYGNAAGHALLNSGGQALGAGGVAMLSKNPLGVAAYDRLALAAQKRGGFADWQDLLNEARTQGIDLSTGELTGLRSLLANQRQLSRFPETADQMADFVSNRNTQQVPQAMLRFMNTVAPEANTGDAVAAFRGAAKGIGESQDAARTLAASPGYEAAFASGVKPDIIPVLDMIDQKLPNTAGVAKKALEGVRVMLVEQIEGTHIPGQATPNINAATAGRTASTINPNGSAQALTETPIDNYRALHSAKMNIDNVLGKLAETEADANAIKEASTVVTPVKQLLQQTLENAHPGYKAGADIYRSLSPAIEEMRKGAFGRILKMTDPTERINAVDAILNGANNFTPQDIAKARGNYLITGRIDDWNAGVRAWLGNKLAAAMTPTQGGEGNVPGRLYQSIWGDQRQRDIARAALGDAIDMSKVEGIESLMKVLNAARKWLPEGSATATDAGPLPGAAGRVAGTLRGAATLLSPSTYANWGPKLFDAIEAMRTPQARIDLADKLLNANSFNDLSKLRLLQPTSEKALAQTVQILTDAGVIGAGNALGVRRPRDFAAPAMQRK